MRRFLSIVIVLLMLSWVDIGAQSAVYLNEGFEASSLPNGWSNTGGTTTYSSYRWNVFTSTAAEPAYEGDRCLRFNSKNNTPGATNILVSPSITVTIPDTKVSFYVKNPKGGSLHVYLSTDSGKTYAQNLLDTAFSNLEYWTKKEYSLASYVNSNVCVVFVSTSNHSLNDKGYQYLDNFKFYQTPICASPINVNVYNIASTSADVFWSLDNEGNIPSSYKITVVDKSGNYVYNNSSITVGSFLTYSLSGLTPNTEYTVTLQGDCSSASSGLSNFSTEYKFTTLCESVSLPYSQNFDAVTSSCPDCWILDAPNSSSGINTSYKYGSNGKSMKLVSTVGSQVSLSSVQLNHASNDIEVDFMVYATAANTTIDVGLISDPSDFSTFELLYSVNVDEASVWKNIRFNTSNSMKGTATNSSVCFRVPSGYSSTIYIDNVTINQKPTCSRLENPVVNFVDSASVSLSWTEIQTPATGNYIVECVNLSSNDTTYVQTQYSTSSVTGLSPETEYSLRVRNVCAPGDTSEWSNAVTCKTLCGALPLPLMEDFNSSKTLPECWNSSLVQPATSANGSADVGWSIYTGTSSYSKIDGYSLMSPNAGDGARYLLSLPAIHIPDNEEYELVFWMYRPNTTTNECINVYVNSIASLSGAVKLDSVFRGNTSYPAESEGAKFYECFYTIPLKGTVYVMLEASFPDAFSNFRSRNFYIDNLSVTPKPPCRNGINSITDVVDKDAETIKLTWQTKTDERDWIVGVVF